MKRLLIPLLLSAMLISCSGATEPPDSPLSPLTGPGDASTPGSPEAPTVEIPDQDPNLASIEGSIEMEGHPPGTFLATLYLGDPTGSNPLGAYVALDITTAVEGYVMPDGTFVFPNVPEGTYSIVAWTPSGAFIAPNPDTGETWIIDISGNDVFETGHIFVPSPDFSGFE